MRTEGLHVKHEQINYFIFIFYLINWFLLNIFQNVPEKSPAKLGFHSELLKDVYPKLSINISDLQKILDDTMIIPNSHKGFWIEAFKNFENLR